jgi:hypothetical protein
MDDDDVVVYGMVPDGVTSVDIVTAAGGTVESSAASSNTYRISLDKDSIEPGMEIKWVGAEGTSSLDSLLPTDLSC